MEKYIKDERTGIIYELVGDFYLIVGGYESGERPIGIWGQRHKKYLQDCHSGLYTGLLLSGKLKAYLSEVDVQAEDMFLRLVKELAEKEAITETLKATDQMEWVRRMNSVRQSAIETVNDNLIFA